MTKCNHRRSVDISDTWLWCSRCGALRSLLIGVPLGDWAVPKKGWTYNKFREVTKRDELWGKRREVNSD
jgi:hypothetical protein